MTDSSTRSNTTATSSATCKSLGSQTNVPLNPHANEFVPAKIASSTTANSAPAVSTSTAGTPAINVPGRGGADASRTGAGGQRTKIRNWGDGSSACQEKQTPLPLRSGDVRVQQMTFVRELRESGRRQNSSRSHPSCMRRGGQSMSGDVEPATRFYLTEDTHGDAAKLGRRKSRNPRARSSNHTAQETPSCERHEIEGTAEDSTSQAASAAGPAAKGRQRRRQGSSNRHARGSGSIVASSQRTPRARSAHTTYPSNYTSATADKLDHSTRPMDVSKAEATTSTLTRTKPKPMRSGRPRSSGEHTRSVDGEPVVDDKGTSFPALSSTTTGGSQQQAFLPTSPQICVSSQTTPEIAYSALVERFAAERAAEKALASVSDGVREGKTSDFQLRLSVLPGFGEGNPRRENQQVMDAAIMTQGERGKESDDGRRRHSNPVRGTESADGVLLSHPRSSQPPPPSRSSLPPPPPPPTLSIVTLKEDRASTSAATSALKDRLRARWYRLEAARKADRQREGAERKLMAIEDCYVSKGVVDDQRGIRRHNNGDGEVDAQRGWGQRGIGQGGSHRVREVDETSNYDSSGEEKNSGDDDNSAEDDEKSLVPAAAMFAYNKEQFTTSSSTNTDANMAASHVVLHTGQKAISAAGTAAIRRSQQATDDLAPSAYNTEATAKNPTVVGVGSDANLPSATSNGVNGQQGSSHERRDSDLHEYDPQDELECDAVSATVAQESVVTERVQAECQSRQAGSLSDLVRPLGGGADYRDKLRRTSLHLVAEGGSLESVVLLLKHGTRLDQRDRWRETPLHKAARFGNSEVVKALCAARMKVNVRNRHRETPLLLAVRSDSEDTVSVLLSYGARLNEPDVNGVTPVCQAAMSGQSKILMAMVNSNQACRKSSRDSIDPNSATNLILDPSSLHPASSARGSTSDSARPRWSSAPAAGRQGDRVGKRRLLSAVHASGALIFGGTRVPTSDVGEGGRGQGGALLPELTPIHEAAGAGQAETLSLLLDLGVSFEERDFVRSGFGDRAAGDTPLARAVRAGELECAKLLLDAGAATSRENARGETPLIVAIRAGNTSAVELLVRRGTRFDDGDVGIRQRTEQGRLLASTARRLVDRTDPLELALREGHLSCAAVLVEGGTRITSRALQAVRLEPSAPTSGRSGASGTSLRYAGGGLTANGNGTESTPHVVSGAAKLSFQTDLLDSMSSDIAEADESTASNGSRVLIDSQRIQASFQARDVTYGAGESAKSIVGGVIERAAAAAAGGERPIKTDDKKVNRVGGLLPGLGECDAVLILADESRLPVHSCLLAAFSGAFRDLFLGFSDCHRPNERCRSAYPRRCGCCCDGSNPSPVCTPGAKPPITSPTSTRGDIGSIPSFNGQIYAAASGVLAGVVPPSEEGGGIGGGNFVGDDRNHNPVKSTVPFVRLTPRDPRTVEALDGGTRTLPEESAMAIAREDAEPVANTAQDLPAPSENDKEDRRARASAVYALLVEHYELGSAAAETTKRATTSNSRTASTLSRALCEEEVDVAAKNAATTIVAVLSEKHPDGATATCERSAVVGWGAGRGEVWIRFWGVSVVAALVRHCYCGRPPTSMRHPGELVKLLAAAASLRMARLMRQVEALLFATLAQQPNSKKLTDHRRAETMLRAARALGATDLESRCTLLLQANGTSPKVMKLRRQLRIPSLNLSDVGRGLDRLHGSGFLGSGPAHSWSSAVVPGHIVAQNAGVAAVTTAAKRTVDFAFRKRAVEFDQLVPLLLDPSRCSSALSIGRRERVLLLKSAMNEACVGISKDSIIASSYGGDDAQSTCAHECGLLSQHHRSCCRRSRLARSNGFIQNGKMAASPGTGAAAGETQYDQQASASSARPATASLCCAEGGLVAVPAASNFAAFSHGMGWLLRSGVAADVALVLDLHSSAMGDDVHQAPTPCKAGVKTPPRRFVFLAHSLVLGAMSEKFAAMLRFVRRQDDQRPTSDDSDNDSCEINHKANNIATRANIAGNGDTDIYFGSEPGGSLLPTCARKRENTELEEDQVYRETTWPVRSGPSARSCSWCECCRAARPEEFRRPAQVRDRVPRELELRSPLLSPRSLGLFLEFCYTCVLDPNISTVELSELVLLADEYLVPELALQAERLLVESLDAERLHMEPEETASTPLELLQLGVSLGLRALSMAAARTVLLQLERVCSSEAFASSGMTKRELIVAALEASR